MINYDVLGQGKVCKCVLMLFFFPSLFVFASGGETEPCSGLCLCCLSGEEAAQREGVWCDGFV